MMPKKKPVKLLEVLVGLSIEEAEKAVRACGLEPDTLPQGQQTKDIALAKNIVRLRHNKQGVIVTAETQASIDAKYQ